jgi:transposase
MKTAPEIKLSKEERATLKKLTSSGSEQARVLRRAHILLMAAERAINRGSKSGQHKHASNSNLAIAKDVGVTDKTVSRVRQRFMQGGLEAALYDKPRVGRPPIIDGEAEARLTMLACSSPPQGRSSWTLQLLANKMVELGYVPHLSDTWVGTLLKKTSSSPGA